MPSLDAPEHPLVAVLNGAYAPLIENGALDIVHLEENEVEIQADDWTLHLEGWPITVAWIALDEAPASTKEHVLALDSALGARDLAAMRSANHRLDGAIIAALEDSGDPLSEVLATVLTDTGDEDFGDDDDDDTKENGSDDDET